MSELILFIISTIIACVTLMLFPKNVAKQNGITWLVATGLTLICSWVFFGGIVNLLGVRLNLYTISVINITIAAVTTVGISIKKKTQKYYIDFNDVAIMFVMLVIAVAIGLVRFNIRMDIFAYGSDDSVRHFNYARNLANTGMIDNGKYVMHLVDMVFIRCFSPFLSELQWHRAFMLADIFLFFIQGAMFWTWIRRFINGKYSLILGYGFTIMYMLGYPLMNMLYGFEYLGAGVLVINYLLWIIQKMDYDEITEWMSVPLITIANAAVCLSYTQFAPVVLLGELVYLLLYFKAKKQLLSARALTTLGIGFGAPGALCISYIAPRYWAQIVPIMGIGIGAILLIATVVFIIIKIRFLQLKINMSDVWKNFQKYMNEHTKLRIILTCIIIFVLVVVAYRYVFLGMIVRYTTQEGGMALDGSIYREPYANFVVLALPMLMYVTGAIKKRKNDAVLWMMAGTVVFAAWLGYCVIKGSIGSYYFYKMHFLFWLFLFGCAFRQLVWLTGKARRIVIIYLSGAMLLFAVVIASAGKTQGNSIFARVFDVYSENVRMLETGGNVDRDMQSIYSKAAEIVEIKDVFIPYFGEELRHLREYYYYLSGQNPQDHPFHLNDKYYPSYDIWKDLTEMGVRYIFVQNNCKAMPEKYLEEFEDMRVVYENEYGKILALDY